MSDVTTGEFIKSKLMTDNINMEPTGSLRMLGLAEMGCYTMTLRIF